MGLKVSGLVKSYPKQEVLRGLDLSLAAGEVVAVRGQSGTGKSTLLHCLGLLDRPDAGSIELDGQELTGLSPGRQARLRAQRIGFVFQAFHLLPEFDAQENALMSARTAGLPLGEATRRCQALFATLSLQGKERSDVRTLSGGERQRVALCRALLPRPALLLADEPTGNLDPVTATVVLDEILRLAREEGSGVVLVTHDSGIAARANRRLELQAGRLEACG